MTCINFQTSIFTKGMYTLENGTTKKFSFYKKKSLQSLEYTETVSGLQAPVPVSQIACM